MCAASSNISKKESFTVSSGCNETYKLPAHSLERTVNLSRQQEIRERKGGEGGEDLYLTKRFIWKQRVSFLAKNCFATINQLLALTFIIAQATLRAKPRLYLPIKNCNSCLCRKVRYTPRAVVWVNQTFIRTNPSILIKSARRNHLKKKHVRFWQNYRQKSHEFIVSQITNTPLRK